MTDLRRTPEFLRPMFLYIGGQDLDLLLAPGQTLAEAAAEMVAPADVQGAVAYLDRLLDGRRSAAELKGWVNRNLANVYLHRSSDAERFLRSLRDVLKSL